MQIRAIGSSRLPSNEPSDKLERLLHLGTLTFYSPTSSSPSTGGRLRKGLRFLLLSLISFVDECLSSLMPHSPPFFLFSSFPSSLFSLAFFATLISRRELPPSSLQFLLGCRRGFNGVVGRRNRCSRVLHFSSVFPVVQPPRPLLSLVSSVARVCFQVVRID